MDSHVYWARGSNLEIRSRQHQESWRWLFARWHNVSLFAIMTVRHAEVFLLIPGWWSRYDWTRLLCARTPPVLLYCIGVFMNFWDHKGSLNFIAKSEKLLMTMTRFCAACCHAARRIFLVISSSIINATALSLGC